MSNCLFEVYKKKKNDSGLIESREVFAVRDDKDGYPHFLIYEDNEWKYVKAKHFVPTNIALKS